MTKELLSTILELLACGRSRNRQIRSEIDAAEKTLRSSREELRESEEYQEWLKKVYEKVKGRIEEEGRDDG